MTETNNNFVPISEAYSEKVRFVLDLPPYVDSQRIGVDLAKIEKLCRIGGIGHLRISRGEDEETSTSVPTVVGFDSQGSAFAGKIGLKTKASTFTTDVSGSDSNKPHAFQWANADIKINLRETTERINSDKRWIEGGGRSPEAWAYSLNDSLRKGISSAGVDHLVWGMNRTNTGWWLFQTIDASALAANSEPIQLLWSNGFHPHVPGLAEVVAEIAFRYFLINSIFYITYWSERQNHRWSLFNGPQIDRAILLKLFSSRATLIKATEEAK